MNGDINRELINELRREPRIRERRALMPFTAKILPTSASRSPLKRMEMKEPAITRTAPLDRSREIRALVTLTERPRGRVMHFAVTAIARSIFRSRPCLAERGSLGSSRKSRRSVNRFPRCNAIINRPLIRLPKTTRTLRRLLSQEKETDGMCVGNSTRCGENDSLGDFELPYRRRAPAGV